MKDLKRFVDRNIAPLLLLCFCGIMAAFLSVRTNSFFSVKNAVNILEANSYRMLLAVGMMCIISSGAIDLSVGSMLSFSAICMAKALKAELPVGLCVGVALLMGASGVQMGSRFLLAEECILHPKAKQAIIDAVDTDSTVTGFTKNDSVRGLKNKWSEAYLQKEYSGAPAEELMALARGTNWKGAMEGDTENGFILVGMSLNRLNRIQPVQEIMAELVSETEERLALGAQLLRI